MFRTSTAAFEKKGESVTGHLPSTPLLSEDARHEVAVCVAVERPRRRVQRRLYRVLCGLLAGPPQRLGILNSKFKILNSNFLIPNSGLQDDDGFRPPAEHRGACRESTPDWLLIPK